MRPFLPPIVVSAVFILWAPFIGQIRDWIKSAFPGHFVAIVAGAIGTVLAATLLAAVFRIRTHRLARYGAFALSAAVFVLWIAAFQTGNAEVDAVERFHFIEYGLVSLLFFRAVRDTGDPSVVLLTLLCGLLVGTLEEWVQWFVPRRVGDVRDVFLNLYAVTGGIVFAFGLLPPGTWSWRVGADARRRAVRFAAAVVLVFAGFFHCAHLGYEIADPEIGRFRSYFTAAELDRLSAARAEAWRRDPPQALPVLAKEDYFLTEGGWHAQARNNAYAARDFFTAWRENRILERYYAPFLGLRSFSSHQPHRWEPAQRTEVEAGRGAPDAGGYLSQAGLNRVYVRPTKPEFWAGVIALAAGLVALSLLAGRGESPHGLRGPGE